MLTQKHKRPPEGAALVWFGVCASLASETRAQKKCRAGKKQQRGAKERGAADCAAPAEIWDLILFCDLASFDSEFVKRWSIS
jgi:hypothetical protein